MSRGLHGRSSSSYEQVAGLGEALRRRSAREARREALPRLHPSPSSELRRPRFTQVSFLLKLLELLLDIEGGEDRECLAVLAQTDYLFSCTEAVLAAEPSL